MALSFIPEWDSACDLATGLPALIAEFLELDATLHRRFREESVSDLLVASILRLNNKNIIALIPDELKTGSDFDIIVLNAATKEAIQFRIQAKRLVPNQANWEISSYKKLAHPNNTGVQSKTLIKSSAAEKIYTIPLYAFYNPFGICLASGSIISGLELASGRDVARIVKALVRAKPKRPPLKRLKYLRHLFFPLSTILCATGSTGPNALPEPSDSRNSVEKIISNLAMSYPARDIEQEFDLEPLSLSYVETSDRILGPKKLARAVSAQTLRMRRFPNIIESALAHRSTDKIQRAKVPRPRILLISETSDE